MVPVEPDAAGSVGVAADGSVDPEPVEPEPAEPVCVASPSDGAGLPHRLAVPGLGIPIALITSAAGSEARENCPVVAVPVPVDRPHAALSAFSWSSASSRASSSKSSCFSARFSADSSASCVALAWSSVADSTACAWSTEFAAPCTAVLLTSRVSSARCASSWACCWASVRRSAASSTVARTWPAVTRSPTLTFTAVSFPPLAKPRFCSVDAASAPDDVTAVLTVVRSTRAVVGPGGVDALVQAASVQASTTRAGPDVRVKRRTRAQTSGSGPRAHNGGGSGRPAGGRCACLPRRDHGALLSAHSDVPLLLDETRMRTLIDARHLEREGRAAATGSCPPLFSAR